MFGFKVQLIKLNVKYRALKMEHFIQSKATFFLFSLSSFFPHTRGRETKNNYLHNYTWDCFAEFCAFVEWNMVPI